MPDKWRRPFSHPARIARLARRPKCQGALANGLYGEEGYDGHDDDAIRRLLGRRRRHLSPLPIEGEEAGSLRPSSEVDDGESSLSDGGIGPTA